MSSRGLLLAGVNLGRDPFFSNVIALYKCNGTNGSNTFTDSSNVGRSSTAIATSPTVTISNTATLGIPPKFGSGCFKCPGQNYNGLSLAGTDMALTGDFCLDQWISFAEARPGGFYYSPIVSDSYNVSATNINTNFAFAITGSPTNRLTFFHNGHSIVLDVGPGSSGFNNDGLWHHTSLTRSGSTLAIHANGILLGSTTFTGQLAAAAYPITYGVWSWYGSWVAPIGGSQATYTGYMDCMRVTKGVARYPVGGNFVPNFNYLP